MMTAPPQRIQTASGEAHVPTVPDVAGQPVQTSQAQSSCSTCYLRNVCLPRAVSTDELVQIGDLTQLKRKITRGHEVYRTGDSFHALYVVRSGSFKSVARGALKAKVTGLHLPAEILGLEAISSGVHDYDAVALEDGEVCVLPYPALAQLASRVPALQTHLLELLSADIVRDRGLMLLLGGMTAQERVASFLIRLSDRYQKLGYAGRRFSMRMRRDDLASYLGLSEETVSRIFAHLQRNGLITARSRDIEVNDLARLRSLGTH